MTVLNTAMDLVNFRNALLSQRDPQKSCVTICSGTGCLASRSKEVATAFSEEIKSQDLADSVDIRLTGCHGFCEHGPVIVIFPKKI